MGGRDLDFLCGCLTSCWASGGIFLPVRSSCSLFEVDHGIKIQEILEQRSRFDPHNVIIIVLFSTDSNNETVSAVHSPDCRSGHW